MCTFCGYGACDNCSKKKRYYPQSEVKNGLHESRGTICKLCDRKFFIRKHVESTRKKIDANEAAIQAVRVRKTKMKAELKDEKVVQDE